MLAIYSVDLHAVLILEQKGGPMSDHATENEMKLYEDEGELLLPSELAADKVTLLPQDPQAEVEGRIRILWGQNMLRDMLEGRYRSVICSVNDDDNSHGMVAQLVELITTSQWTSRSVTSYAKMFHDAVTLHAATDREPYILKYDLDSILVLAILRPKGRDHFTLDEISRGFQTIVKMLKGRRERLPVASVSFLGARSNRLIDPKTGEEPSFEAVLREMYKAGYRGDVYPAPQMWRFGNVGVFPSYPFPASLDRMRAGGF